MNLVFADGAWEDYLYWQANDPDILARIHVLIRDAQRDPFQGLGKPEPLKGTLSGFWSRRITREDRMVYRVSGSELWIVQLRFHY
jgi:toxin YoeB